MKIINLNFQFPHILGALFFLTTFECSATSISDGLFNASSWRATLLESTGGANHSVQQALTGGNPDQYRFMTHNFSGAGNLVVFHEYLDASYNPSLEGAINSITYSEDRIFFNPPFSGAAIGAAAAIMQDGKVFFGPSSTYTSTSWTTLEQDSLTMLDFVANDSTNPDFLETGSEIIFGYARSNSTGGFTGQTRHGIDNWLVTINPVPVPAAVWLFGSGLVGLIGIRKKASKISELSA